RFGRAPAGFINPVFVHIVGNWTSDLNQGAESGPGTSDGMVDSIAFSTAFWLHVSTRLDADCNANLQLSDSGHPFHGDHSRHSVARSNIVRSIARSYRADGNRPGSVFTKRFAIPE